MDELARAYCESDAAWESFQACPTDATWADYKQCKARERELISVIGTPLTYKQMAEKINSDLCLREFNTSAHEIEQWMRTQGNLVGLPFQALADDTARRLRDDGKLM